MPIPPFGFPIDARLLIYGTLEGYNSFLARLYRSTPPSPLSSRWYTTDACAFFYYCMRLFGILGNFALNAAPRHRHGDIFREIEDDKKYLEIAHKRITRLTPYLPSFNFTRDSAVAMVTSFPSWKLARQIESVDETKMGATIGIEADLGAFRL